ncbi:UDP-N-acetylmuramoyl-L-alanine--D-glutamate ligase [Holzapfeliella sp. He02]|uniref:UDP-N-acetylmuramoylalanine--D-glutamate ligase n=1 Tax=Holzapfeliella saturejae TaxID=3082953 RepID=A0ABU8SG09_9LACO
MENADYKNKTVLVLGMGKSGYSAARVLLSLGCQVFLNESKDLTQDKNAQELQAKGVLIHSGELALDWFDHYDFDVVVKSPGISYENQMVKKALEQNISIVTEPEIGFSICRAKVIGITGSNGKTTTTTLVTDMLNNGLQKGKAYAVGNIGVPVCDVVQNVTEEDVLVTELSSFQLMGMPSIKPDIAAIIDIYPTHLDYHKTFDNYVNAKLSITSNQSAEQFLLVNEDQPDIFKIEEDNSQASLIPISLEGKSESAISIKSGFLYYQNEPVIKIDEIKLPGQHNLQNISFAVAIVKLMGIGNEAIQKTLTSFTGVKHRLQYVDEIDGRKVYNDSKATNIEAALVAINSFAKPEVLIAGGLDRGFEFDELVPALKEHVNKIVLYGETKALMAKAAKQAGITDISVVDTLEQAVPLAFSKSVPGEVILFSPAAASWDQFKSFEERGDCFIKYVKSLVVN